MKFGNILNLKNKNFEFYIGLLLILYIILILFLPVIITINKKIIIILACLPFFVLFFLQHFEIKFFFLLILSFGFQNFFNKSFTVSNFTLFIPILLILIFYKKRDNLFRFEPNITTIPLLLFLTATIINVAFSKSPLLSFHLILNYLQAFIIGYYIILYVDNENKFRILIIFLGLSCIYPVILGLVYSGYSIGDPLNRISGSFMSSNEFAAYLAFYFFFFTGLLLFLKNIYLKILSGIFTCIIFYLFLNTLSRGAMVGFLFSFVTLLILLMPKEKKFSSLLIILLFLLIASILFSSLGGMKYLNRFFMTKDVNIDFSTVERLGIWRSGLLMFSESPITGYGLNTFQEYYPSFFPSYGIGMVSDRHKHAHNIFINTLAEQGIIGLIFLLIIMILIFRYIIKIYSYERNLGKVKFSAIFLSFYIYFIVHNCFDTIWTVYHHVALFINLIVFLTLIILYKKYILHIMEMRNL